LLAASALAHAEAQLTEPRAEPQSEAAASETQASPQVADKTQDLLLYALSLNGTRYKFGGRSVESGFDCSGFVSYVYDKTTGLSLPRTARAISHPDRKSLKANSSRVTWCSSTPCAAPSPMSALSWRQSLHPRQQLQQRRCHGIGFERKILVQALRCARRLALSE